MLKQKRKVYWINENKRKNKRVDGCWELVVRGVVLSILFVVERLSSFSKSLLNTWLRDRLVRRLRFVRLRSRNGFNEDDEDDKTIGIDNRWVSSVDTDEGGGGGIVSEFIDYYL